VRFLSSDEQSKTTVMLQSFASALELAFMGSEMTPST